MTEENGTDNLVFFSNQSGIAGKVANEGKPIISNNAPTMFQFLYLALVSKVEMLKKPLNLGRIKKEIWRLLTLLEGLFTRDIKKILQKNLEMKLCF